MPNAGRPFVFMVIESTTRPGQLSVRLDATDLFGGGFMQALVTNGYKPGDRIRAEPWGTVDDEPTDVKP